MSTVGTLPPAIAVLWKKTSLREPSGLIKPKARSAKYLVMCLALLYLGYAAVYGAV